MILSFSDDFVILSFCMRFTELEIIRQNKIFTIFSQNKGVPVLVGRCNTETNCPGNQIWSMVIL